MSTDKQRARPTGRPSHNPTAGAIEITLDRPRRILLDFNALAEFEGATGRNALTMELWQQPTASDLRALVWAGLLHEDPELTLKHVGAWMTFDKLITIQAGMGQALEAALPETEPGQGEEADSPPPLTG